MTAASGIAVALDRPVPPLGGFSPAILRLEVRRLLRNRRTMTFALVLPGAAGQGCCGTTPEATG